MTNQEAVRLGRDGGLVLPATPPAETELSSRSEAEYFAELPFLMQRALLRLAFEALDRTPDELLMLRRLFAATGAADLPDVAKAYLRFCGDVADAVRAEDVRAGLAAAGVLGDVEGEGR